METIRGKRALVLDVTGLKQQFTDYNRVLLDLGTGDGRYARSLAIRHPDCFIIGVDSCRENLREHSQAPLNNLLFVIANAQTLPAELNGLISHISINFPWGSLLESLLSGDARLMHGLEAIARNPASLDLRLNGGALAEAGLALETGTKIIHGQLLRAGWDMRSPVMMDGCALRNFSSTWAKRLAFGRDPRALLLNGQK